MREILEIMNIKAKNAHSLKLYFILFYLLFFVKFNSQEFISIETLKSTYPFKKYTLKTNELYGFDKTLDVYNFFISSDNILLVTLLPNLEGQSNWLPVKENEIRDKIMSISKLRDWIDTMPTGYKELSHRKLLDKAGGDYFISYNSLFELFSVKEYYNPLISQLGVLNKADKKVSIKNMYNVFEKTFPKKHFILDPRDDNRIRYLDDGYVFKNYLSKKFKIKNQNAYQFWTFDGWWAIDGYNVNRGIDRLIYIPNLGIVGGSYDFYFELKPRAMYDNVIPLPVDEEKLWDNIINEKIMIAEELK